MKIDIWSDIRCPFCYIGKHNLEQALSQFKDGDKLEVVWHSYELDPTIETDENINTLDYFVQNKGISKEQAQQMMHHPVEMGKELGLVFNFDKAVVANSFKAHRLIKLAQKHNKANEAEEALFKAHFTDGVNIDDNQSLLKIGKEIGIDVAEIEAIFTSDIYTQEVKQDIVRSQQLRISGVPFFVFNNKYAISGAQPVETFTRALEKSYHEFAQENNIEILNQGDSCDMDGNCD
ncbi:MAG: DsbA family oxidoreductase [Brumimicrobium sp.]|nr:DsbA family oxidoreductase [Brumimicrobium sp.]